MNTKIINILNLFYTIIFLFFILDTFTPLEIKNQNIKSFIYFGIIIFTPLILIINLWKGKSIKFKIITSIISILTLISIIFIGPLKIIYLSSSWKTDRIIYQNKILTNNRIEYQMQDVGALGYNKRTVEVIYFTENFMFVKPFNKNNFKSNEWIEINKVVNELELKY